MKAPPLLPEETLLRVLRVARLDGWSVALVAGLFALLSALFGDVLGAIVGLLVAGSGAVELHGATLLEHGERRGMNWVTTSQLLMLASILGYCAVQLLRARVPAFPPELDALIQQNADQFGVSKHDFLLFVYNRLLYTLLAVGTFVYQGGMALYYYRRRETVTRALEATPEPPVLD